MHYICISLLLSHPHTCSDSLVCDEFFCEVIGGSPHMSVTTQDSYPPMMMMIGMEDRTEVVSLLLEAGANIHVQDKVEYV